jgi:hypothetical protein
MSFFLSPFVDAVVLATAIINILGLLSIFFTCRFVPGSHFTAPLMRFNWFKPVYKYHSYIWWVFMPSAFLHALLAIIHRLVGG